MEFDVEVIFGGVASFTVEADTEEEAMDMADAEAQMEVPMEAEIDTISVTEK